MPGDTRFEFGELRRVAAQQVEHVLAGTHRPLDATQRIAVDGFVDALQRDHELVGSGGEPLAQRGGLRGDVVTASGHHRRAVLRSMLDESCEHRDAVRVHVTQRLQDLQLLDVLGEVAARHALVDLLVPGERVELFDTRLHVVAGDALTFGDRREVDLVDDGLVVGDRTGGDVDPQILLRLQNGQPQAAFERDLVGRRPDLGEVSRRISTGQNIGDGRFRHANSLVVRSAVAVHGRMAAHRPRAPAQIAMHVPPEP